MKALELSIPSVPIQSGLLNTIQHEEVSKEHPADSISQMSQMSHFEVSSERMEELKAQEQLVSKTDGWNLEQERQLFQYHKQYGNRWAKISLLMNGKSDNCIKNHFYCTLRKALRRVNRYINQNKRSVASKEVKSVVLSKIISVAEKRFQSEKDLPTSIIQLSCSIIQKLIRFARDVVITEATKLLTLQLITQISEFARSVKKRKSKKPRKNISQHKQNRKILPKKPENAMIQKQQQQIVSIEDYDREENNPRRSPQYYDIQIQHNDIPSYFRQEENSPQLIELGSMSPMSIGLNTLDNPYNRFTEFGNQRQYLVLGEQQSGDNLGE